VIDAGEHRTDDIETDDIGTTWVARHPGATHVIVREDHWPNCWPRAASSWSSSTPMPPPPAAHR
jgi:hypothetical protein